MWQDWQLLHYTRHTKWCSSHFEQCQGLFRCGWDVWHVRIIILRLLSMWKASFGLYWSTKGANARKGSQKPLRDCNKTIFIQVHINVSLTHQMHLQAFLHTTLGASEESRLMFHFDDVYIWQQDSFTLGLISIQKKVRKPPRSQAWICSFILTVVAEGKQKHPNIAEGGGIHAGPPGEQFNVGLEQISRLKLNSVITVMGLNKMEWGSPQG